MPEDVPILVVPQPNTPLYQEASVYVSTWFYCVFVNMILLFMYSSFFGCQ
ncbi:OSJNBa0053K19.23-like protein [Zea mays]|jgi:hypothetical protein|uniref:OSJNBa0053K19.23-like protein n=1 Tax=Zea mays TaxID=4577 RepID=A0A1D6JEW6_MAIZE|nr:OSJNBa0053K19.23-like protein [Zea mays]